MEDGKIIENIDFNFDTSKAEKSLSSFTQKILKAFRQTKIDPLESFTKDIKASQDRVSELEKALNNLKDKEISVKYSDKEIKAFEQEYTAINKRLAELDRVRNTLGEDQMHKSLLQEEQKLKERAEYIEQLSSMDFTKGVFKGSDTVEYAELTKELQNQKELVNQLQASWETWAKSQSADKLKESIEQIEAKLKELNSLTKEEAMGMSDADFQKWSDDVNTHAKALEACNGALKSMKTEENSSNASHKKTTSNVNVLKQAFNGLKNAAKKVGSTLANIFKKGVTKAVALPFKGISKLNNGLLFMVKAGLGIRGLYMLFRKLRSYIQEGVNTVAGGNETVKKSVATLSGALSQLKTALGVIVAPLVNALAPALAYVAQLATTAANAIARFFASLTGQKTVVQASVNTQAYADALENSADAAKDALGAYDKLNVIQDSSSSGSGSGTSGASSLIDTTTVNDEFAKMWENADFSSLGKELGTKLRNALLGIDWKGTIQPFAEKFAKSITSFINGAISVPELGKTIGMTIGNAIQTGVQFAYSFASTLNWKGIGEFIASSIRGAVYAIDPQMLADTIHEFINGAIELLIGVFDPNSGTFKELGTKVGQFLASLFSEDNMSETSQNLSTMWGNIKQSFVDFVNAIIDEIEKSNPELTNWVNVFSEVGQTIGSVVKGIGDAIGWVISQGPEFTLFIVGIIAVVVLFKDTIVDMLKSLFTHGTTATEATNKLKESFGSFLDKLGTATVIAAVALALQALATVIDSVSNFIEVCGQNSDSLVDSFLGLNLTIVVIAAALAALALVFDTCKVGAGLLIGVLVAFALAITALGEALPPIADAIKVINDSFGDLAETIGGVVTKVIEAIGDALARPIEACQQLFDTCSDTLPTIIDDLTEFIKKVKNGTDELKSFAKQSKSTWESASKDVNTYSTNTTNTLSKLKSSVNELFEAIKTSSSTIWSSIGNQTTSSLNTMSASMTKVLNTIKTGITTNVQSIKTVLSELKTFTTTTFNDSASSFGNYGDGFKSLLNKMIGYAQQFANAIASAMDAVAQSINNINIKIPSWVPNYGGKSWRPSVSGGVRVNVPYLAKGAVLPPNQPFLAMLGDQKQGTNVEAPLDTIVQAMQQALGSASGTNQPIVLQLDGKTVAKVVWDENKKRYKQTGKAYSY